MYPRIEFRHVISVLIFAMAISSLSIVPATSSVPSSMTTCVNLESKKERISRTGSCRTGREAIANWRLVPSDSAIQSESAAKYLTICSNKESSQFSYQIIRDMCGKSMRKSIYTRTSSAPSKPMIKTVSSNSHESISLILESDPSSNSGGPITYFTIMSNKGDIRKVFSWRGSRLTIDGLQQSSTYAFTVTATNVDGTSQESEKSIPVNTQAYVPVLATQVATPAFNLSSTAETRTVNTLLTGYSIFSTGGTISSFSISPAAPMGTTFNTSTGLLSGTPASIAAATTYTISATNSAGTATRTFTLTVSAVVYTVGQTGPGGGVIFYVATTPFACGPTRANTCTYLEVAPSGWLGSPDPQLQWASANQSTSVPGISDGFNDYNNSLAIGMGYKNSIAIVAQGSDANSAAGAARAYTGGSRSDWYLPSTAELNLLCQWNRGVIQDVATICTGGTLNSATYGASAAGFASDHYWSSSEFDQYTGWFQFFGDGYQLYYQKFVTYFVRPVRAF